jgi:hypothetical protein
LNDTPQAASEVSQDCHEADQAQGGHQEEDGGEADVTSDQPRLHRRRARSRPSDADTHSDGGDVGQSWRDTRAKTLA